MLILKNKLPMTIAGALIGGYVGFAQAGDKCPKFPVLLQICRAFAIPSAIAGGAAKGAGLAFVASSGYKILSKDATPGVINPKLITWGCVGVAVTLTLYSSPPQVNNNANANVTANVTAAATKTSVVVGNVNDLFKTSTSIGSIALCAAEGNCLPDGSKTKFYKLHRDPGDGRINGGYCSASAGRNPGTSHMTGLAQLEELCRRENQGDARMLAGIFASHGLDPKKHISAFVNAVDMANQMNNKHAVAFVGDYARNPGMEMGLLRAKSSHTKLGGLHKACFGIHRFRKSTSKKHACVVKDQRRRASQIEKVLAPKASLSNPLPSGTFIAGFTKKHHGIDFKAPIGTTVLAAHDGLVIESGWQDFGLGNRVEILGDNGWVTVYGHNSQLLVKKETGSTRVTL